MDKKQVTDLRSELLDSRFWCEVYFHYRRIKTFSAARNARRCRISDYQ